MDKPLNLIKIIEENQLNEIIEKCVRKFPDGDRRVISETVKGYYKECRDYIRIKKSGNGKNIFNMPIQDRFKLLYESEITEKLNGMECITPIRIEKELIERVDYVLLNYRSCQPIKEGLAEIIPLKPKN